MSHHESPKKRGKPFLKPENRVRFYQQMQDQAQDFYAGDFHGVPDTRSSEFVNGLHDVDFLDSIIPSVIQRVQKTTPHKKIHILDIGCGIGRFTDEIRRRFGNTVEVFGTSLDKKKSKLKKRYLSTAHPQAYNMEPTIHPNDAKWRSLMELHDFPEFDLMIETFGDIYHHEGDYRSFLQLLHVAIRKLLPAGQLYIATLGESNKSLIKKQQTTLEQTERVSISWNDSGYGVVITKLENQPT